MNRFFAVVGALPELGIAMLLAASLGCSSGKFTPPQMYEPQKAAEVAMESYDTNGNGKIEADELEQCPALKGALPRFDTDKDGAISLDELANRIEIYHSMPEFFSATIVLVSGGKPAVGVDATIEFESFMGDNLQQYPGKTGDGGAIIFDEDKLPWHFSLLPQGLYRVRVSSPKEIVRGCEVAGDVPRIGTGQVFVRLD